MKTAMFGTFLLTTLTSFAQQFVFSKSIGGNGIEIPSGMEISSKASIYWFGSYRSDTVRASTCSFTQAVSPNSDYGVLMKYDTTGNCLWERRLKAISGSTCSVSCFDIAVDSEENVFIGASISGTLDVDPGPSVNQVSIPSGFSSFLLSKYDKNGLLVWAFTIKDTIGNSYGTGISIDKANNLVFTGMVKSVVDFDPSLNTYNLPCTGHYINTGFLAKYTNSGNLMWAFPFLMPYPPANPSSAGTVRIESIAIDSDNNIILTGNASKTIDFDLSAGVDTLRTPNGGYFLAKYNQNGIKQWAFTVDGGPNNAFGFYGNNVSVTANNYIYVSGCFRSSNYQLDFDPSPSNTQTLVSNGLGDIFFAKYTPLGNMVFTKAIGGISEDDGEVTIDKCGSFYWRISTSSPLIDLDFTTTVKNYTGLGGYDNIIIQADSNGKALKDIAVASPYFDNYFYLHSQFNGSVYILGLYNNEICDFDPGLATFQPAYYGIIDILLLKYRFGPKCSKDGVQTGTGVSEGLISDVSIRLFPNPSGMILHLECSEPIERVFIYNMQGDLVLNLESERLTEVNIESLCSSVYVVEILTANGRYVRKFLKQE